MHEQPDRTTPVRNVWPRHSAVARRAIVTMVGVPVVVLAAMIVERARGDTAGQTVPAQSPVAVAVDERGGRAFVVTTGRYGSNAHLLALDTATGAVLRAVPVAAGATSLVVDRRLGHVLALDGSAGISMVDGQTGRLLGTTGRLHGAEVPSLLAVAQDSRTGFVFVAHGWNLGHGLGVSVISARTGRVLRQLAFGAHISNISALAVAVDERTDRVFVLYSYQSARRYRDAVASFAARSGVLVSSVAIGAPGTGIPAMPDAQRLLVAARAGRMVVIDGAATTLALLDARTGPRLARVRVGGQIVSAAMDDRKGQVLVADSRAAVTAVDVRSGRLRWTARALVGTVAALTIDEGRRLVFACIPGVGVTVIDPDHGLARYTVPLPAVGADPGPLLDTRTGSLVLRTADNRVAILGADHRTVRMLSPGWPTDEVALDGRAGRVIATGTWLWQGDAPVEWAPGWLRPLLPWSQRPRGDGRILDVPIG